MWGCTDNVCVMLGTACHLQVMLAALRQVTVFEPKRIWHLSHYAFTAKLMHVL